MIIKRFCRAELVFSRNYQSAGQGENRGSPALIHIRPEIAKGGRAGDVLLSDAQLSLRRSDFVHLLGLVEHGIGDLE
jgi:hypothetical protein